MVTRCPACGHLPGEKTRADRLRALAVQLTVEAMTASESSAEVVERVTALYRALDALDRSADAAG